MTVETLIRYGAFDCMKISKSERRIIKRENKECSKSFAFKREKDILFLHVIYKLSIVFELQSPSFANKEH